MLRIVKNYFHLFEAIFATTRYGNPAKKMTIIGVTGTDGKTTTTMLIGHILREAGFKVAIISTIAADINGKIFDTGFHTTTPSSLKVQKFLHMAKLADCKYVVLEVTSHALDQNRVWGIPFEVGVITNVTHEHLDYHKTYNEYLKTKSILLKKSKYKVINADDASYDYLSKIFSNNNTYTYSLGKEGAYVDIDILPEKSVLVGKYNKENALAAASVCKLLEVNYQKVKDAIKTFKLPEGRQELIHDDSFKVLVDFAHTPNAFESVLSEIRKTTKGKIIHVFGAAGKRDASKRPLMGEIASKYDDLIILTAEDPRGENVSKICEEIAAGIKNKKTYKIILDRKDAIFYALETAKKEDMVVITGKGHEKSINVNGQEEEWNEKNIIVDSLNRLSA